MKSFQVRISEFLHRRLWVLVFAITLILALTVAQAPLSIVSGIDLSSRIYACQASSGGC